MISYIGSFIILIALLNASLLVLSKPILSKITSGYDSLILSTSNSMSSIFSAMFKY